MQQKDVSAIGRNLSIERRELIRERYEIYRDLPIEEQRKIRDNNIRQFKKLNRERRQANA